MGMLALILIALPVGFLIGMVGIGGVLLAPALANLFGRDIHQAVSLSLASFVVAGAVAAFQARRAEAFLGFADWCLLAALVPGALMGALAAPPLFRRRRWRPLSPPASCWRDCRAFALREPVVANRDGLAPAVLAALGLGAGFLSVISGTGGPMILVPVLLAAGMEVRPAAGRFADRAIAGRGDRDARQRCRRNAGFCRRGAAARVRGRRNAGGPCSIAADGRVRAASCRRMVPGGHGRRPDGTRPVAHGAGGMIAPYLTTRTGAPSMKARMSSTMSGKYLS